MVDREDDAVAAIVVGLIIISSLVAFAGIVSFALHALGNDKLSPAQRKNWALLLVFGWPVAAPWYWAIERRRKHAAATSPQGET